SNEVFNEGLLRKLALSSGAVKRFRKLSGSQLFDLLLFDGNCSLNQLSMQATARHGLVISKQGLHQKFNEGMQAFMKSAFEKLLAVKLTDEAIQGLEITIKDSTRFALPANMAGELSGLAGSGMEAGAAVQFEFGLKSGRADIKLTAANANDQQESHLGKEYIRPGEVYIRDLGYTHAAYMVNVAEKGAFFVNKLHSQALIYTRKGDGYELLDLATVKGLTDIQAFIGAQKLPVRLVIEPVSEGVKNKRIAQLAKYNKKKGHKTSEQFKLRAGFNLFVTNMDGEAYSAALIQELYHLRWQVELVFKAWKSIMGLNQIGKGCIYRTWCRLYAKLIWVILGWKATTAIGKVGQVSPLKVYGLVAATKEALRQQLWKTNGHWLQIIGKLPFSKVQKEQRKQRLKIEDIISII
ncbi:IS4 family transposase, partial [Mucilaginibacter psychrotolerans]